MYMFKLAKKLTRNVSNIFNVNYKDARMSVAFIVNFEHISHFILQLNRTNKC